MAPIQFSVDDFNDFVDNPTDSMFVEWATDMFILATGLTDMPADAMEARLVKLAIFQMAWYLREDHASREEYFSGFNTEHLGSYYYSKYYRGGGFSRDEDGGLPRVPAFDRAVEYFSRSIPGFSELFSSSTSTYYFYPDGSDYGGAPKGIHGDNLPRMW